MIDVCKHRTHNISCTSCEKSLESAISLISSAFISGHKLLVCGNGGSSSDSDHIVAEFIKTKFKRGKEEYIGFKAISLCSNSSVLTAISNDYGFDWVFAQQVYALGDPEDVLLAISTSGRSRNVLLALEAAQNKGMKTILLTGQAPNSILFSDCTIQVCGKYTEEIQEMHIKIYHTLCNHVIEACIK